MVAEDGRPMWRLSSKTELLDTLRRSRFGCERRVPEDGRPCGGLAYVADQGTGTTIIDCSAEAISFGLSDAPLLGCTTTGLDRALPASPIIRFDASQGLLIIRPEVTDAQVTIMDVQERLATHWMRTGADTIDLSHLPAGCYLVRVDGSSGPAMLRFTTI
jgi:hypothetical protein